MQRSGVRGALAACLAVVMALSIAACGTSAGSSSETEAASSAKTTETSSIAVDKKAQALLPTEYAKGGSITLATDPSYPPCESVDANGQIVGFEPDLWNALGAKLGLTVNVEKIQFDGLIPGLVSGRFPIAMECLSDSAEREKTVSFVDFALDGGATITMAENPKNISADPLTLCGLKTAAQVGTDFIESLKDGVNKNCEENGKPPVEISEFPTNDASLLALYSGRVDFIVQDAFGAADVKKNAPKPVVSFPNPLVEPLYIGVVVKKEDTELREALLAAMQSAFADGTYEEIMRNWDIPKDAWLKEPGVNLATAKPLPEPSAG